MALFKTRRVANRHLSDYSQFVDAGFRREMEGLAARLRGVRVLLLNSAPKLGGVAAMLRCTVPLLKDMGLAATWRSLDGLPPDVYAVTKGIHNGLQGANHVITSDEWRLFEEYNRRLATEIQSQKWDIVYVHDHQLAPLRSLVETNPNTHWLWRSHIDSTKPNKVYEQQYVKWVQLYDAVFFTMDDFVLDGLDPARVIISPVAIDPLATKNKPMALGRARRRLAKFGIDTNRPIVTQVSRFDPWKDHLGVVAAWRLAAKRIPGLQLLLIADVSTSDRQGLGVQRQVREAVGGHPDAFVLTNRTSLLDGKAAIVASNVVLQKSIREGFGLTVAEAMWAGTPVIGGDVGGIRLQIDDGRSGFLVSDPQQCAERIVQIIQDPPLAATLAKAGREHVRQHSLIPRMLRDELRVMAGVIGR